MDGNGYNCSVIEVDVLTGPLNIWKVDFSSDDFRGFAGLLTAWAFFFVTFEGFCRPTSSERGPLKMIYDTMNFSHESWMLWIPTIQLSPREAWSLSLGVEAAHNMDVLSPNGCHWQAQTHYTHNTHLKEIGSFGSIPCSAANCSRYKPACWSVQIRWFEFGNPSQKCLKIKVFRNCM